MKKVFKFGCLGIIGIIVLFIVIGIFAGEETATVSKDEYYQLKKGMTIEKVTEIVGGKEKSTYDNGTFIEYEFDGENGIEKDATVTLMFNKEDQLDVIIENGLLSKHQKVKEAEIEEPITWEEKVKDVAATDGTETEKFDAISMYAKDYKPTEDEIAEFEEDIIKEYKDGKYIMDISNHEYMLGNIFKADVIQKYYDDSEQNPMESFAFDFYQNSKYNYRGIDNRTSESTLSNERQMDKILAEIGK